MPVFNNWLTKVPEILSISSPRLVWISFAMPLLNPLRQCLRYSRLRLPPVAPSAGMGSSGLLSSKASKATALPPWAWGLRLNPLLQHCKMPGILLDSMCTSLAARGGMREGVCVYLERDTVGSECFCNKSPLKLIVAKNTEFIIWYSSRVGEEFRYPSTGLKSRSSQLCSLGEATGRMFSFFAFTTF